MHEYQRWVGSILHAYMSCQGRNCILNWERWIVVFWSDRWILVNCSCVHALMHSYWWVDYLALHYVESMMCFLIDVWWVVMFCNELRESVWWMHFVCIMTLCCWWFMLILYTVEIWCSICCCSKPDNVFVNMLFLLIT
jgi:hypothetical protein